MRGVLRGALVVATLILAPLSSPSHEPRCPSPDEARIAQDKFRKERDQLVQSGAAKRFLPILLQKAEEMGKRGDEALAQGRSLQAIELYRQARWQLPYQS